MLLSTTSSIFDPVRWTVSTTNVNNTNTSINGVNVSRKDDPVDHQSISNINMSSNSSLTSNSNNLGNEDWQIIGASLWRWSNIRAQRIVYPTARHQPLVRRAGPFITSLNASAMARVIMVDHRASPMMLLEAFCRYSFSVFGMVRHCL